MVEEDRIDTVGCPLAVRPEVEQAHDTQVQVVLSRSMWTQCSSWYRQADGRITTNWPLLGTQYKARAKFNPDDYDVIVVGSDFVAPIP